MSLPLSAKVKTVLSGDTVVLVPVKSAQVPVPERTLTLQYVRADSFQAREFLRRLLTGKTVRFSVLFKLPSGKEFGDVHAPVFASLIEHMVELGWARVKDNARADSDAEDDRLARLRALEETAQKKQLGVHAPAFTEPRVEPLSAATAARSRKAGLPAVVERVISGDRAVMRVFVNKDQHAVQPVLVAGYRSPRTDDADPKLARLGQQAKAALEDALLAQRGAATVRFVGESQAGVPVAVIALADGTTAAEQIMDRGLGEVVDWQSPLLGAEAMAALRQREQSARALGKGLFAAAKPAAPAVKAAVPASAVASALHVRPGATFDHVVVAKAVSGDTLVVRMPAGDEVTVQLASVRAPRTNDTTFSAAHQQALVQMSREFVRAHTVGKPAAMRVDGIRAASETMEARPLVALRVGSKDLSEQLVTSGLATVMRHGKQTAHERALHWDRLIELEDVAKREGKRGVFCTGDVAKVLTVATRVVNASENLAKARTFFSALHKKGRISGFHVEYVPSATRVRLYNPREGTKLTVLLGGLANDRGSAVASEALEFMNRKFLHRNVEFEVYDTDKLGGFIGNLFANALAEKPAQVDLLTAGLASVHELALSSNPFEAELRAAEDTAKAGHKGVWKDYDEAQVRRDAEAATAKLSLLSMEAATPKFFDIEIVDVAKTQVLSFHFIDTATSAAFADFKQSFNNFHAQNVSASITSVDLPSALSKAPKKNDIVSAKFSENGKYYRARVVNYDRGTNMYDVKHVDFGNVDQVSLSALRGLPKKFGLDVVKPFAHTCKLQNISLPPNKPKDYLTEALYVLEDLTFDKKLVLSGLPSASEGVEYYGILYDSEQSLTDADYTINKQLVLEGYGMVDTKCAPHLKSYVEEMVKAELKAKNERAGCWELGDIRAEEDF